MGWNGVGILAKVERRMDIEQYVSILEDNLLSSMENSGISKESIIFQQDNDPKHSSKRPQNWLKSQVDFPTPVLNAVCLEERLNSERTKIVALIGVEMDFIVL